jgi:hypothetical protein
MIDRLYKIFKEIDLSYIDSSANIYKSGEYHALLSIFPNLENFFQERKEKDEDEFQRTIKHIFRLFKIFFLIKSGENFHDTLSPESFNIIRKKLLNQHSQNEFIIPIILMYHDIGRLENKKEHPDYSYHIILKENMFEAFELSEVNKLLINKVIQYHLLFATIYTGESTYYGIYSLLNDTHLTKLLSDKKIINRFIDLLEIFTYLDIMGYSYARIYDHYIGYYEEINTKLKDILSLWPNKDFALGKALEYSQEWMEWRIAGALRIFQYVGTESYLTEKFYFNKIKENPNDHLSKGNGWNSLTDNYLVILSKIQIKYGLAMLMLLAIGKFFRGPIKEDQKISNNLILFWSLLSKEIEKRSSKKDEYLWNIHFNGLPNWWKWDRKFKQVLNYDTLDHIIKNGSQDLDNERKEFNLYLDFTSIFN